MPKGGPALYARGTRQLPLTGLHTTNEVCSWREGPRPVAIIELPRVIALSFEARVSRLARDRQGLRNDLSWCRRVETKTRFQKHPGSSTYPQSYLHGRCCTCFLHIWARDADRKDSNSQISRLSGARPTSCGNSYRRSWSKRSSHHDEKYMQKLLRTQERPAHTASRTHESRGLWVYLHHGLGQGRYLGAGMHSDRACDAKTCLWNALLARLLAKVKVWSPNLKQ